MIIFTITYEEEDDIYSIDEKSKHKAHSIFHPKLKGEPSTLSYKSSTSFKSFLEESPVCAHVLSLYICRVYHKIIKVLCIISLTTKSCLVTH